MKSKFVKLISLLMGSIFVLSSATACQEAVEVPPVTLPDYSATTDEIGFCGYCSPGTGVFTMDGLEYTTMDFCTEERFKEYLDAGNNIVMIRYGDTFPSSATAADWEDSRANRIFDTSYKAGVDKVLLTDEYFNRLIWAREGLIGNNVDCYFRTVEEMEQAVADRLAIYKDEPNFYGIMMVDEPSWKDLKSYGLVYRAIKKVVPDAFLHANFHPGTAGTADICDVESFKAEHGRYPTRREGYAEYFRVFFEESGADRLAVDAYPFLSDTWSTGRFKENYFSGIQVLKEVCDEFGAELNFTIQTNAFARRGKFENRVVDKSDIWLQVNALLGFGATDIFFYTYQSYPNESSTGGYIEEGSFLTKQGEKTNVYYYGQQVMNEVKKFQNVLLNYKFNGAKFYLGEVIGNGSASLFTLGTIEFDNQHEHTLLTSLKQQGDALLTTELIDEKNNLYMYMI